MKTWILTTGNSDIHLKHDKNWDTLYSQVQNDFECNDIEPKRIHPTDKDQGFSLPARALGLVYQNQPEYYEDLEFPLINTFCNLIEQENIKLDKIIILLTDQTSLFPQWQQLNAKCPYWQDTITLKPLFTEYFNKRLHIKPEFIILEPQSNKGLDHWEATLKLVDTELEELNFNQNHTVYVSHQAGTPAISSALQFVSLGKFSKVQYLVSNQYYDDDFNQKAEAEIINSSQYQRGIQIQKAKQLVTSGFPGAALKVLDGINIKNNTAKPELEKLVDFFNLYNRDAGASEDFTITEATQRIVNALDLVGVFFSHQNYLQGISILAAAQETFMKVAILSRIANIKDTININNQQLNVSDLIKWQASGLFLDVTLKYQPIEIKKHILQKLNFPVSTLKLETDNDFAQTNRNNALIAWLKKLEPNFNPWLLLDWSCQKYRNNEEDLRNQLLHNLRGMETKDVIKYLLGDDKPKDTDTDVMKIYNEKVKQPFFSAIDLFNLSYKRERVHNILKEIAELLN